MGLLTVVGLALDAVPLIRTLWRWVQERQMEVRIEPIRDYVIQYAVPNERNKIPDIPVIDAKLRLTFINHRTDRRERIIGCSLLLKQRHLIFWKRTIVDIPMRAYEGNINLPRPWDFELAPTSSPFTIEAEAVGQGFVEGQQQIPKRMEMFISFEMVGPIRRLERKLSNVRHEHNGEADRETPTLAPEGQ